MKERYFDHVAVNPLAPEVLEAMLPYLRQEFGNPLSPYALGGRAKEAIERAREQVAALLNVKPAGVIFTANGAEANNFAVRGLALAKQDKGKHIIVSKVEHHSILNAARFIEKQGFTATFLPVDKYGLVSPEALEKAITPETTVVSILTASPEVGTIEPIKELAAIAHKRGVLFHTDAVAAAGNIPLDVEAIGADAVSISAHQFYGPKGAAALYVKPGTRIVPLIYGGIQEGGRRAGTEDVPAIVGMGKAAELAVQRLTSRIDHVRFLRDRLVQGILKTSNVELTGHPTERLPGHASFVVEYIEGEAMLLMLSFKGILVASGSACSSKALKSSPVLLSMGVPTATAQGSVVFTLGEGTTNEDIDYVLTEFSQVIARLREISPYAAKGWGDKDGGAQCTPQK